MRCLLILALCLSAVPAAATRIVRVTPKVAPAGTAAAAVGTRIGAVGALSAAPASPLAQPSALPARLSASPSAASPIDPAAEPLSEAEMVRRLYADHSLPASILILNLNEIDRGADERPLGAKLAALREQTIADLGAGVKLEMVKLLVDTLGFARERVHALDPALPAAEVDGVVRVRGTMEQPPAHWRGKFDTVISNFVFNSEIVDGIVPGMGGGIDSVQAAFAVHEMLKPGGRAVINTGGSGIDPKAEQALGTFLTPVPQRAGDYLRVYEKAGP